jgi:hypothetical protein
MRNEVEERTLVSRRVPSRARVVVGCGVKKVEERRCKSVIDPPGFASWHLAKVRDKCYLQLWHQALSLNDKSDSRIDQHSQTCGRDLEKGSGMEVWGKGKDCAKTIQFPARLVLEQVSLQSQHHIISVDRSTRDSL